MKCFDSMNWQPEKLTCRMRRTTPHWTTIRPYFPFPEHSPACTRSMWQFRWQEQKSGPIRRYHVEVDSGVVPSAFSVSRIYLTFSHSLTFSRTNFYQTWNRWFTIFWNGGITPKFVMRAHIVNWQSLLIVPITVLPLILSNICDHVIINSWMWIMFFRYKERQMLLSWIEFHENHFTCSWYTFGFCYTTSSLKFPDIGFFTAKPRFFSAHFRFQWAASVSWRF